jgi:hypothetical protein
MIIVILPCQTSLIDFTIRNKCFNLHILATRLVGLINQVVFHIKVAYLYRSTISYIGKNVIVIPFPLGFDSFTLFSFHSFILTNT